VLVRGEEDAIAVLAPVGDVREAADLEEIGGGEQRQGVRAPEPLATLDFPGDRA
jgi:hypothetical protein